MTVNKVIQKADYNLIRNSVTQLLGTGAGSRGYGQKIASSEVDEASKVTVNEWANLAYDIINVYNHQTGSNPTLSAALVNSLIRSDGDATSFNASISGTTMTVSSVISGMLAVGQVVLGTGVNNNTVITEQLSGSPWGASTWTVSKNQSLTSRTLTSQSSTTYPYMQYNTFIDGSRADDLIANRFALPPVNTIVDTTSFPILSSTVNFTAAVQSTVTVTFNSSDEARYFFNSGGELRFRASFTPSLLNSQNYSWRDTLATMSSTPAVFGGNKPSNTFTTMNGRNFYSLTSTAQEWYRLTQSSPYTSNTLTITASTPGIANNSAGAARTIQFILRFTDGYTDPGPPAPGDSVQGTMSIKIDTARATGALVPSGVFTISNPTSISIGAIG